MSKITYSVIAALSFSLLTAAQSQQQLDSTKADPQHHKVIFENDQVRVVHYLLLPGEKTTRHSHPDNVNVFLTDARIKNTSDEMTTEVQAKAGAVAWRPALIHVTENIGDKPLEGILVEPKSPHSARPLGSADETTLPSGLSKAVFENERVRVVRYRFEPGDKDEMHGHPDRVQILLTDSKTRVMTLDGKTTLSQGEAGQVYWWPAVQHSVQNVGDNPLEGILVEMKGAHAVASR